MNTLNPKTQTLQKTTANSTNGIDSNTVNSISIKTKDHILKILFYVTGFIGNMLCVNKVMIPIGRQYKKEALSHFNILGVIG